MKKIVLAIVAVTAVIAALVFVITRDDRPDARAPKGADTAADADAEKLAAEKARAAEHKPRAHAQDEAKAEGLAVAGVVKTADGRPVAGATVDAFAVPAGDDVPDEDRTMREFLAKSFGRATADRLVSRGKKLRSAATSGDASRMGDVMQDGMEMGMELLADEGGMDAITAMMRAGRDLATADDADWPKAGSAATDAGGAFRIEGLAAGRVELRAKAPSHVKTKQRVNAGDIAVSIQLERGARLTGVVTCEKDAVVGASVLIRGAATKTGAGGRFEFDAAHAPSETLVVSAENCCAQGQTVALSLDGPAKELAIALDPAGSAAGHVSSIAGGPIAGARVTLGGSGNMFADMMGMAGGAGRFDVPPPPAVTDANGAFEVHGLHVGATKLRIDADGWLGTSVSVTVKRGETSPVEALLLRESVLAGAVRDDKGAPVAGAKVRVEVPSRDPAMGMVANMMGGTFKSALADDKGNFEVHGLAEGDRKVRVEAAKYLTLEDKVAIPAQSATTRDFTLREGFKLAGSVAGPDGKAFGGAKVYVSGKPAAGGNPMAAMFGGGRKKDAVAESGADGNWSADGLPEGPYEVKASADGFLDGEAKDVAPGRTDVALTLGAAATIKGRVIALADMKPVAGATVQRKSPDAPGAPASRGGRGTRGGRNPFAALLGGGGSSATTDKDGVFEMKGLEPGDYELTASMRGFADSDVVKLTCAAGQTADGVDIALPPGVTVTGLVVEKASGAGVAGAVVWAAKGDASPFTGMAVSDVTGGDPQAPANSISTRTDAGGRFVLDGVPPGKVNVEVRVADHAPATLAGVAAPSNDLRVEVSGGGAVAGRVTGADGSPLAGSQLMVMRGMMGQGARQAKTDANGDFLVEHLTAGAYQLMLLDPANPMAPTMASVTVKDGETARHDFTKKAGGRQVGGAASKDGKPLANAPIMLMGGSAGLKMATTDDKGHFSFDGLDAGDYTVMVQSSFVNGGSTSKKVTVGSDGKIEDVNLQLSSAKVEGDVIDAETGKGVAGAQIALMEPGTGAGSGSEVIGAYRGQGFTDERGHFAINDVQAGTFSLKATAAEYSPVTLEGVPSGSTGLKVQMRRGVEFPVTVVGPDGAAVANATVQTVDASGNASMVFDMTMSSITRADGVARLRLAPGHYTLKVSAADLLTANADVDTSAGAATVHLDAGATVEVSVTDGSSPVAGAKVKLLDAAGREITPGLTMANFMGGNDRTDAAGAFSRRGLPAGAATVVVTDAAGRETRTDATLEMNRTRHVDLVIAK